jgi:hypothetical protein
MSAREKWEPTDVERAEHEALHKRALAEHAVRMLDKQPNGQTPTDKELLS